MDARKIDLGYRALKLAGDDRLGGVVAVREDLGSALFDAAAEPGIPQWLSAVLLDAAAQQFPLAMMGRDGGPETPERPGPSPVEVRRWALRVAPPW